MSLDDPMAENSSQNPGKRRFENIKMIFLYPLIQAAHF
jgi:hypothetical protein